MATALHILHVEDDDIDREMIRRCLAKANLDCEVTQALSGRQALTLLRQRTFDLLLIDDRLSDMNGPELLEAAWPSCSSTGIPILILTGDLAAVHQYADHEVSGVLDKNTLSRESLLTAIRAAVAC